MGFEPTYRFNPITRFRVERVTAGLRYLSVKQEIILASRAAMVKVKMSIRGKVCTLGVMIEKNVIFVNKCIVASVKKYTEKKVFRRECFFLPRQGLRPLKL